MKPLKEDPAVSQEVSEWTAALFAERVELLEAAFLKKARYRIQVLKAPYLLQVMKSTRKELEIAMREIEEKEELRDAYTRTHPYATTVIQTLMDTDTRIRDYFQAIQIYCLMRQKELRALAPLLVQFRAYFQLHQRIGAEMEGLEKSLPDNRFMMEVRKRDSRAPYIKVYCQGKEDVSTLAAVLTHLQCVRVANPSEGDLGGGSLSVYPAKGSPIGETETAVRKALENYFNGKR